MPNSRSALLRCSLALVAALMLATTVQAQTFTFGGPWMADSGASGVVEFNFVLDGAVRRFTARFTGQIFGVDSPSIGPLSATPSGGSTTWSQVAHPVFGDVTVTLKDGRVTFTTTNPPPPGVPLSGIGQFASTDITDPTNRLEIDFTQAGGALTGNVRAILGAVVPTLTPLWTMVLLSLMLFAGLTVLRRRRALEPVS